MSVVIDHPPSFINAFLQQKLGPDFGAIPMFPTVPTDMASLAQEFSINNLTEGTPGIFVFNGNAAIYDRMFKMRRLPFPHIKCEQLLYYFNALEENAVPNLIRITQRIQDLLDNGDESAEDINAWILSTFEIEEVLDGDKKRPMAVVPGHGTFYVPYFHNFKIYQLEETRDIIDFGTARTYAGNKMIIDYDWHPVYNKNP
jgi:hypothetical protein